MANFDTTTSSRLFVNNLICDKNTFLVMDGLISAKNKDPEDTRIFLSKVPQGGHTGKYVEESFKIVSKLVVEDDIVFQIQTVSTKETYYISESLFNRHFREVQP